VDASGMTLLRTIVLRHSDKPDAENQGGGVPNYLGAVAISPDGTSAIVPSKQDNVARGTLRSGANLTFQNTVRAISSRIDLAAGTEDYAHRIDHDNSSVAAATVFDPNGIYVFVALETSREVAVVDAYASRELFRFNVGRAPQGLAISPDGLRLYVTNFDEVQDFEGQIRALEGGTGLMTDTAFNTGTRSLPLGDPKAGLSADLDALAAYVASLNQFGRSPNRNADGTLTTAGAAGRNVFRRENCAACHSGTAFTDSSTN